MGYAPLKVSLAPKGASPKNLGDATSNWTQKIPCGAHR